MLPITAVEAVRALEPYCGEFLYTHVDKEGLMQGTDMDAIMAVRRATHRRVTAAGGITTWAEIDRLDAAGVDAVVGMAVYTGQLSLDRTIRSKANGKGQSEVEFECRPRFELRSGGELHLDPVQQQAAG